MGMSLVASFAAIVGGVWSATMTSTLRRTSSAALLGRRLTRPSAERISKRIFRPSVVGATTADELDTAFASAVAQHADAMIVFGDYLSNQEAPRVTALAANHHLPAI
jgi:hypothetical protein